MSYYHDQDMTWNEETYIEKKPEFNRTCIVCEKVFNIKYRKLPTHSMTCGKKCSATYRQKIIPEESLERYHKKLRNSLQEMKKRFVKKKSCSR